LILNRKSPVETAENIGREYSSAFQRCRAIFMNISKHWIGSALVNNRLGNNNISLGFEAGRNITNGSNNIDIGNPGVTGEGNKIRIGQQGTQNGTFIAGIYRATVASGVGVMARSNGKLGTIQSAQRFKDAIKPMDKASEAVLALKPVSFRYKKDIDPSGTPQFGLVAEDVEKVNPDLVVRDESGDVSSVRYEAVNAMLLNEFLKAHRRMKGQEATIARQQKQIEALAAGLQKVSAQLEVSKPASQTASNNQ
jgi:Chaperone of endosialidase